MKGLCRLSAALLCVALGACGGGVKFERTTGIGKFKSLPAKTVVQVAESPDLLPQPTLVLGTLRADSTKADAGKTVVADFKKEAAKLGCDAVVALACDRDDKKSTRTVETLGEGGKKVKTQQEVVTSVWHWHAQCVRTGAMGDTLRPAGGPPAPSDDPPAPVPAPIDSAPKDSADTRAAKRVADAMLKSPAFLRGWQGKLEAPVVDPLDTLDAMAELMIQVTGPTGLWRKTMPETWFGCKDTPDSPPCRKVTEMSRDLHKADALHEEVTRVTRSGSGGWLRHNEARLLDYLATYVPAEPSLSAVQATPYFQSKLKDVVP